MNFNLNDVSIKIPDLYEFSEKHRRRTGAFFTPKKWVDEAHKMLDEQLGPNWREEYVVWDASAGTANLTRDYRFKELYISTLEQTDVDIIKQSGFNPEATVFQFDFLNDSIEDSVIGGPSKLPEGLKKALRENRPIVFLNNPPYGTSSEYRYNLNSSNRKEVITSNHLVIQEMKNKKLGKESTDLLARFIFRMTEISNNLNNCNIVLFSKHNFFSIPTYSILRKNMFLNSFDYIDGFIFSAKDFSDIPGDWCVAFTMFKTKRK